MEQRQALTPDYAWIFVENIGRSVRATLARVQRDTNPVLAEETRTRALHVLSFALRVPAAWPATRELLMALAPKLEQGGYRGEWLPYLARGLAVSETCHDARANAELHLHIGHLHRLRSEFEQARTWLTASAEAFAALGERQKQARALNQLAYVAWQQHRHNEVQRLAQAALGLLDETELERAMSLSALGLAAIEQYRWQEAEELHRTALQIRTEHGDRRQMAWSLQNVGYALRGQGKYEAAIACYEEALSALQELNDAGNCAIVQMNLGIVYSLRGEPVKALEVYTAAESTFRRIGDELNLAKVLTSKGIDALAMQNWQQAEESFVASTGLFNKLGDLSEYLNSLDGLGMSCMEQGFYDRALTLFDTIFAQLPQIVGTRAHPILTKVINDQLDQAKARKNARTIRIEVCPKADLSNSCSVSDNA